MSVGFGNPDELRLKYKSEQDAKEEIENIRDNLMAMVCDELDEVGLKILAMAISLCPCDTGSLRESIKLDSSGSKAANSDGYEINISAGDETINPKSGKTTAEYAMLIHDGHATKDIFYEGVPFLTDAVDFYQEELNAIVDRVCSENGWNIQD